MSIPFPSEAWAKALMEKLNTSDTYAAIAKNWEGDLVFVIESDPASPVLSQPFVMYLDLWHGKCRDAYQLPNLEGKQPAFILSGKLSDFVRVIQGKLDPMQAMLTRKIGVKGNMVTMMRNVPTVLEFVRTCTTVESEFPS